MKNDRIALVLVTDRRRLRFSVFLQRERTAKVVGDHPLSLLVIGWMIYKVMSRTMNYVCGGNSSVNRLFFIVLLTISLLNDFFSSFDLSQSRVCDQTREFISIRKMSTANGQRGPPPK